MADKKLQELSYKDRLVLKEKTDLSNAYEVELLEQKVKKYKNKWDDTLVKNQTNYDNSVDAFNLSVFNGDSPETVAEKRQAVIDYENGRKFLKETYAVLFPEKA